MNDFLKFATSRGMNSMHVENAMNAWLVTSAPLSLKSDN